MAKGIIAEVQSRDRDSDCGCNVSGSKSDRLRNKARNVVGESSRLFMSFILAFLGATDLFSNLLGDLEDR